MGWEWGDQRKDLEQGRGRRGLETKDHRPSGSDRRIHSTLCPRANGKENKHKKVKNVLWNLQMTAGETHCVCIGGLWRFRGDSEKCSRGTEDFQS